MKTDTNEPVKVTGTLNVKVQYKNQFKKLVLVVRAGNGPSLLGWTWLNHINLNWKKLFAVRTTRLGSLHTFMQQHKCHFEEGLGTADPYKVCRFSREPNRNFSNPDQYPLLLEMK